MAYYIGIFDDFLHIKSKREKAKHQKEKREGGYIRLTF